MNYEDHRVNLRKRTKTPTFIVIVDQKQASLTNLANAFLAALKTQAKPKTPITDTTEIIKKMKSPLRALFGDLDLVADCPETSLVLN